MKIFKTTEYNIDASGIVDVTKELQHLIDLTAEENGMLILEKGTYLTSSLFLKSNILKRVQDCWHPYMMKHIP